MKIRTDTTILGLDDKPIAKLEERVDGETRTVVDHGPLTVRDVFVAAMGGTLPGDERMTDGEMRTKFAKMAHDAYNKDEVDWPVEDVTKAKERVALLHTFSHVVVWRVRDICDGRVAANDNPADGESAPTSATA